MSAQSEMQAGGRFAFGANWARFLADLDETRIADAEASLREMLGVVRLDGLRFLDIGCGSGLFSLAARRLGAEVHSFDFDPQSVACTLELRKRYFANDANWRIESRLGARPRLHGGAGELRRRLQLGRAASHRRDVAGPGARDRLRGERDGQAVHRDLQRPGLEVASVVAREGILQSPAAVAAGTVRQLLPALSSACSSSSSTRSGSDRWSRLRRWRATGANAA